MDLFEIPTDEYRKHLDEGGLPQWVYDLLRVHMGMGHYRVPLNGGSEARASVTQYWVDLANSVGLVATRHGGYAVIITRRSSSVGRAAES